ncbi:MAG: sulfite exporter TauE/SafE family protein [Candidatus Rokubacteria bacterium]|nr:sulfite exporter TauE/SafE family protein [Candidatus Rokubacteria bacterium]
MIEFLFAVSGTIAAALQGLKDDGVVSVTALALISLGGLIAGVSPSGVAAGLAVLGQLHPVDRRPKPNHGLTVASTFSLGMVTALGALGLLAAWGGRILTGFGLAKWLPLLTLIMGLNMLGVIRWKWLRCLGASGEAASGPTQAFLMGVPFGVATSPCALPVLVTALAVAAAKGNAVFGLGGLVAFGLGRSIPVLLLGLFSDQSWTLPKIQRVAPCLRRVAGGLITAVSLYFLTLGRDLLG